MRAQSPDTSPEAERVLIGLFRQAPAWRKLRMVEDTSRAVKDLLMMVKAGIYHVWCDSSESPHQQIEGQEAHRPASVLAREGWTRIGGDDQQFMPGIGAGKNGQVGRVEIAS